MDFLQFLSWACMVFTIGMFSTGLADLKKMKESQSADRVQFLPFLTTCLNNLGWLYYGLLKKDITLVIVNTIGSSLQSLYMFVYCHYTKDKRRVLTQMLAAAAVLCGGWLYFGVLVPSGDQQLSQLGLACSVFTISMYLSPLTDLFDIMRSGSVERLSFALTVATFLTSTSWTLYGLQLQDFYIMEEEEEPEDITPAPWELPVSNLVAAKAVPLANEPISVLNSDIGDCISVREQTVLGTARRLFLSTSLCQFVFMPSGSQPSHREPWETQHSWKEAGWALGGTRSRGAELGAAAAGACRVDPDGAAGHSECEQDTEAKVCVGPASLERNRTPRGGDNCSVTPR